MTIGICPSNQGPVEEARETFPVERTTCASCVKRTEKRLKNLDGVLDARLNLATEKATVEYDPARVEILDFQRAVEDAGYGLAQAEMQAEGTTESIDLGLAGRRELTTLRNKTALALIAGALIMLGSLPTWTGVPFSAWFAWVPAWLQNSYILRALAIPVQFWSGWQVQPGRLCRGSGRL